jgi:chromosome segregation ATPase
LVGGTIGYGVGVFLVLAAVLSLVSLGLIGSVGLSLPSITGSSDSPGGDSAGSDLGAANEELSEAVETASEARQELDSGNVEQALDPQRRCFDKLGSEIEDIETGLGQIHSQLQEVTDELESIQQEENIQSSDLWGQLKNLNKLLESDPSKNQVRFLLEKFNNTYEQLSRDITGTDEVREGFVLLKQANKTVEQTESLISESEEIIEHSVDTLERIEEVTSEDQEQEAQSLATKAHGLDQKLSQLASKVETIENQISNAFDQAGSDAELLHKNAERLKDAAERASYINSKLKDLGFRPEAFRERTADDSHVAGFLERLEELEPKLRALAKVREEEARTLEQNS